jgi:hypothetical protein
MSPRSVTSTRGGLVDASTIVTLIATTVSAATTVVLAVLTAKYVRLTSALADEARSAKYPNVFVDLELDRFGIKFVVGNTGASPAQNIRFRVQDSIPWQKAEKLPSGISFLSVVKNGLAYLPPGRTLKFHAGYVAHNVDAFVSENTVDIELTYDVEVGKTVTRNVVINLGAYAGVLYESFSNPAKEVARAIRDTESRNSTRGFSNEIISRLTKFLCPICKSEIPRGAKKCPKCHEFLPEKTDEKEDI